MTNHLPPCSGSSCIPLADITDQAVGGKAAGLMHLQRLSLPVPPTFVVVGATPDHLPADLAAHYAAIGGGRVAVRSSAIGEDSADASFAGQYETILDVEGIDALKDALNHCLASVTSARARAYQDAKQQTSDVAMTVVVQRMVDARAAGVLFTADPVTGRRNCVVLDAVAGLGEALVSGTETPDHYRVSPEGKVLHAELVGATPILDAAEISRLVAGAKQAEAAAGHPLDLEWGIDKDGSLYWLQARPITVLPADPNELDTLAGEITDLYTRYNVGEVMPGATTPLSYSTTGRGLDTGIQGLHVRVGMQARIEPTNRFFALFYGRIFFNLTGLARMADHMFGASTESVAWALCGRAVPELKTADTVSFWRKLCNTRRYLQLAVWQRGQEMATMRTRVGRLVVPLARTAIQQYTHIEQCLPELDRCHQHHIAISTGAGMLEPIVLQMLQRQEPTASDEALHARMAALLVAASEENVESADIAAGIQRVIAALQQTTDASLHFGAVEPAAALQWITDASAGVAYRAFSEYLHLHGHRAFQEFEMRQTEWEADPLPLIAAIQAAFRAQTGAAASRKDNQANAQLLRELNPVLRWFVKKAQHAVQQREASKSLLIRATTQFKKAYRHLATLLVQDGLLNDADEIFFLTHQELGKLIHGHHTHASQLAQARRSTFFIQETLEFEDIFQGIPEPIDPQRSDDFENDVLHGKPVSHGQVQGIVRVVRTLDEATQLQQGEILVTPVTDIGWTPYFGVIAGLITDVGSSVSHGAVIAREYGLPAVVNTRMGTRVLHTGDEILLDGNTGNIHLLRRADGGAEK
ncbi:MAG: hypothetical protein IT470_07715 [Pseudomonadales bacterium]|nr:hypothetical protein [Pseudomonadales bacterium]